MVEGLNVSVSIDKIAIVGYDSGTFEKTVNDKYFDFIQTNRSAKHPYKKSFLCSDGSFMNWGEAPNVSPLRYEFNPNKIEPSKENEHRKNVVRMLRTMKHPKVNRYDIAIDFKGIDLSDMTFIDMSSRKQNLWLDGSGRLETRYIGAKSSDLQIRVYDKGREQKKDDDVWWRIEAQVRGESCMVFNELGTVFDPFHDIKIAKPSLQSIEKIEQRAMVDYLIRNPHELSSLSRPTRVKYKKLLASLPTDKELELSSIFSDHKEQIEKQLNYWIAFSTRNNPISV